jgi:tubulin-specific chaperone D
LSTSSQTYFSLLLEMQINDLLGPGRFQDNWQREFMEGYVTSADTGAEDLVRASRAALAQFCEAGNTELVYRTLVLILSDYWMAGYDRVIVSCLEVISFLFESRILQKTSSEYAYPSHSPSSIY